MNYHGLVKRLDLPAGWMPSAKLEYDDIRARAISRADNDDDVRGINASIELIRRTRGGNWPIEPVSADFNYVDEVWHECEFREGDSFTYEGIPVHEGLLLQHRDPRATRVRSRQGGRAPRSGKVWIRSSEPVVPASPGDHGQ